MSEPTLVYIGEKKIWRGADDDKSQIAPNPPDEYIAVDTATIYLCLSVGVWTPSVDVKAFLMEILTDPGNTPTGKGHFYLRDRGDGKQQLAFVFPTGAVQILCTEP